MLIDVGYVLACVCCVCSWGALANNNALGQTPTLLHERAESISGFTKGYHLEIPTTPM